MNCFVQVHTYYCIHCFPLAISFKPTRMKNCIIHNAISAKEMYYPTIIFCKTAIRQFIFIRIFINFFKTCFIHHFISIHTCFPPITFSSPFFKKLKPTKSRNSFYFLSVIHSIYFFKIEIF